MTNDTTAENQGCKCDGCTCQDCRCGEHAQKECLPSCGCRRK